MLAKKRLDPRSVSTVRSLEVVASRKLAMYYKYGILIRDLNLCPLQQVCPLLGASAFEGFTERKAKWMVLNMSIIRRFY